jgi:hypothetical protein
MLRNSKAVHAIETLQECGLLPNSGRALLARIVLSMSMASACSEAGMPADPDDQSLAGAPAKVETIGGEKLETIGDDKVETDDLVESSSAALVAGGLYDVGVIPADSSCPAGSELIQIRMDDEDDHNANSRWGWIGATSSDANTVLRFCRVPGDKFKPLSQSNSRTNHYAVLKLSSFCPPNSQDFGRYFDNEDDNTRNWSTGSIYPSSSGRNTQLQFCLFRYGNDTMRQFPTFEGLQYGVFAASDFNPGMRLASGYVHTDDEDHNNANRYSGDASIVAEAQRIVSSGSNTDIGIVRVR